MKKNSIVDSIFSNNRSTAFTIAVVFLLVFGGTSVAIYQHYRSTLLHIIEEDKSTAKLLSNLIYEHQKAAIGILESYATRSLFIDAIQKKEFNHVISQLKSLSDRHVEIDALFLTDQCGTLWANYPVDKQSYGKNLAYRDWYKGVSKGWKPYVSSAYHLIVLDKGTAIAIAVPVLDKKGNVIGILSSAQRTAFLAALIKENKLNPDKRVTLLDREGNIIYSDTIEYEKEIVKYPNFSLIQKAIHDGKNTLEVTEHLKKVSEGILAFSPVKDMGWTVIVSEEKGAIFKSEKRHFIDIFAVALLLFVCVATALFLLQKELRHRETKELLEKERRLREIEASYRILSKNLPCIVYRLLLREKGRMEFYNDMLKEITGYSADELVHGKVCSIESIIVPGDREHVMAVVDKAIERNEPFEVRYHLHTKDGRVRYCMENGRPINGHDGMPISIDGVIFDITEIEEAGEALQTSEKYLRAILEASPESAFLMDKDGRLLMGNKMTSIRLKSDMETLMNENLYNLLPPDVAEGRKKKIQQVIETGEPVHFEDERFGRIIMNSIYPIHGKDNQVDQLAVFGLDITERKLAEEEREGLIIKLQEALSKVKLLSGFLPICASCKKIRNDKGYWEQMEMYIREHSEADFSHGICPECAQKLYPEYYKKIKRSE